VGWKKMKSSNHRSEKGVEDKAKAKDFSINHGKQTGSLVFELCDENVMFHLRRVKPIISDYILLYVCLLAFVTCSYFGATIYPSGLAIIITYIYNIIII
jgi:hypothetical protein